MAVSNPTEQAKSFSADIDRVAIWSRKVDTEQLAGRPRMILAVRQVMEASAPTEHLYLRNLLHRRSISTILHAAGVAASELIHLHLPSFQCLLFSDAANHDELCRRLQDLKPATLYCDGIRSYYFLRKLGSLRDSMHIVVDMDDLMSRRMQLLEKSGLSLSLGYMNNHAPAWAIRILAHPLLARLIAGWEARALRHVEDEIGRYADDVVLLSPIESTELACRYATSSARARVTVIPPPAEVATPAKLYEHFQRFVFIGTDALPQNRSTIAHLITLWTQWNPASILDIYGNMSHPLPQIPGICFHGYAESLSSVYTEGTVLLTPGILRGGVKTKVIEAFSFGCAVVGNEITFEGLELDDYPLLLNDDARLKEVILHPEAYLDLFRRASALGSQLVAQSFSKASFEQAWNSVLTSAQTCGMSAHAHENV